MSEPTNSDDKLDNVIGITPEDTLTLFKERVRYLCEKYKLNCAVAVAVPSEDGKTTRLVLFGEAELTKHIGSAMNLLVAAAKAEHEAKEKPSEV